MRQHARGGSDGGFRFASLRFAGPDFVGPRARQADSRRAMTPRDAIAGGICDRSGIGKVAEIRPVFLLAAEPLAFIGKAPFRGIAESRVAGVGIEFEQGTGDAGGAMRKSGQVVRGL